MLLGIRQLKPTSTGRMLHVDVDYKHRCMKDQVFCTSPVRLKGFLHVHVGCLADCICEVLHQGTEECCTGLGDKQLYCG